MDHKNTNKFYSNVQSAFSSNHPTLRETKDNTVAHE